ncbi:polysaccharide deacetylase family protein [Bacillus sp. C11]|nr:polysaccharide deacetylase family protein [Neobacillus terrae]
MILLFFSLILLLFYTLLPFFISRIIGAGGFKKNSDSQSIAFTFDDGPNPIYTPELLNILKDNDVKAAFFVLGSKAEKYPEIIRQIHKEGHLIGLHNYVHRSNWIMSPWKVRRDLKRSAEIIEGITGERPTYYRPPWGLLNIFDYFLLKEYKIVLWSLMAGDWKTAGGKERVKKVLLSKVKKGDIILLHDCGKTFGADEKAPRNTIDALKDVLMEVKNRNFHCSRIDDIL